MKASVIFILFFTCICNYSSSQDENPVEKKINKSEIQVVGGIHVEVLSACLYASAPYPLPAKNQVSSQIFWNQEYDIKDAVINAYNIFGMKVNTEKINVDKTSPFSGIMSWDCHNIANGVYLIRISLANSKFNVPVVISK